MELGTALMLGANAASAMGSIAQGKEENRQAKFQAAQYAQQAGQQRATAQRAALEERRKQRLVQSTLQANAAASGAGASDPTVMDLSGDLAQEGEYRALTALFDGEEQARGLETGAAVKRYEGASAKRAGYVNAGTTILKGGSSLYDKYSADTTLPGRTGNIRPGGGFY